MCDHCVKRERAYNELSDSDRDAVDRLAAQASLEMDRIARSNPTQEDFDAAYVAYGDSLDILMGIIPAPSVPDSPPDWL